MHRDEYIQYDALGLAQLVRTGEVNPLELLAAAEAQVNALNPRLNAVVTPLWERARRQIEAGLAAGPFHGVPLVLKDLGQYFEGTVTTGGSRLFRDAVADHNSTLTQRYLDAGLVICGKSNTPEFGLATTTEPVLFGPARNPWHTDYSTGGSSGGAGAIVASGMMPAAHASDGGGSIRIPASCCGLFGLKPSRGRVPLGPAALEGWGGLSTTHVVTRSVRDSAALLDISAGAEVGSPYVAPMVANSFASALESPPTGLVIGLCTKPFNGAAVDPEVVDACEQTARLLENLGHTIVPLQPDLDPESVRGAHGILAVSHIGALVQARASALGRAVREDEVERVTWQNAESAKLISGADYAAAVHQIHQHGRVIESLFAKVDVLLTPTMACLPPRLGALDMMSEDSDRYLELLYQMIGFTALFNDTGHPAASVQLNLSQAGLPIGSQLVAAYGDERRLLQLAGQIEAGQHFTEVQPLKALG